MNRSWRLRAKSTRRSSSPGKRWNIFQTLSATFDRDFCVTYMNPCGDRDCGTHGQSRTLGQSLWDLYPDVDWNGSGDEFPPGDDERVPVEFEQYFPDEAREAWFKFLIYPQPAEGIILYVRDTTSTQRTEQALRGSEQLAAAGGWRQASPTRSTIRSRR